MDENEWNWRIRLESRREERWSKEPSRERAGGAPTPCSISGEISGRPPTRDLASPSEPGEPGSDQPESGDALPDFAGYELLDEIGRGGMGVVYRARQLRPNRVVALKVIREGRFASPVDLQRFRAEAEAAATLDHPGIVPIYEVGEAEGRHYFSMSYVQGQSLAERLREGPLDDRQAAEVLVKIADAMAHAHRRGVVHRDLKPGNILLDEAGQPRVSDFGLAKRIEDDSGLTAPGQILGTPSYMAPEQARGEIDRIGTHTDVYALGALLYEMLTGRPPFRGAGPMETLWLIREQDPVEPRRLRPTIDQNLQTICMTCLAREPRRRYATAQELTEDLRRYLRQESILARPPAVGEQLLRTFRESPFPYDITAVRFRLLGYAAFHLAVQVGIFLLLAYRGPEWLVWLAVLTMHAPLCFLLQTDDSASLLPSNPAERHLWALWTGHFMASAGVFLAYRIQHHPDYVAAVLDAYPAYTALTGLAFFVMGSSIWFRNSLFGVLWIVLAAAMPLFPRYAPLAYAALNATVNVSQALHMRRIALTRPRKRSGTAWPTL